MGRKHKHVECPREFEGVIWDIGRTILDPGHVVVSGVRQALVHCERRGYWQGIASILRPGVTAADRLAAMEEIGLRGHFDRDRIRFTTEPTKFDILDEVSQGVSLDKIVVIGDRTADFRCLHWAHERGVGKSIWLRRGKFANELPPPNRQPTHTIESLRELMGIL